jgi:transcription elongation factor Elf1
MPIQKEVRELPEELEPACPRCGQRCRCISKGRMNECIYGCGDCGLQFEAVIELSWDSRHYSK